jgi:DNA-binding MarR family transcriptional regulator
MIKPAQSLREVLWELANHARKLERSDLRRRMGMRYADLDPLLEELEKEDRITRLPSPTGKEMIILKKRQISRTKPARGQEYAQYRVDIDLN